MTKTCVVLIESNTSGTGRLFARGAAQQGFRPVLLSSAPGRYKYVAEEQLEVVEVETQDIAAMLQICQRLAADGGLAGVTSSSEYYIVTAAQLAAQLGLPGGEPEALRACRNKWEQRCCLESAGVGVPKFRSATSVPAAVAAAQQLGYPVVVKPVQGSGSVGVRLCETDEEVLAHAGALLSQSWNERGLPSEGRILIEELVTGPEFSVETFGESLIGITLKSLSSLPYFVEVGHLFPALLSAEVEEQIEEAVRGALKALRLGWGPAHTELRLTPDGVKIIEVNPRLAGGFIPELVRHACGINLIDETLRLVTGQPTRLCKTHHRHAAIRFLLPPAEGTLAKLVDLSTAREVRDVVAAELYCAPGTRLHLHGDFRDRIGHVLAVSDTEAAVLRSVESAGRAIDLHLRPAAAAVF